MWGENRVLLTWTENPYCKLYGIRTFHDDGCTTNKVACKKKKKLEKLPKYVQQHWMPVWKCQVSLFYFLSMHGSTVLTFTNYTTNVANRIYRCDNDVNELITVRRGNRLTVGRYVTARADAGEKKTLQLRHRSMLRYRVRKQNDTARL